MTRLERTAERRAFTVGPIKRISWGAIFGGAVLSIAIMTVFGVLGVAVGAMSMDSAMSASSLGIAAGLWWIVSGVLAIFAGALAAGRMAGFRRRWEGPLHGIIAWALTTVATFALGTSVVASVVSMEPADRPHAGMSGPMEPGMSKISALAAQSDLPEAVWRDVRREATQILLRSTRKMMAETPGQRSMAETGSRMADSLVAAMDELDVAIAGLYRGAKSEISEDDRMAVVDVLVRRTDMSRQDARQRVERWSESLENAWSMAKQGLGSASQEMHQAPMHMSPGEMHMTPGQMQMTPAQRTRGISGAAWFTFFYLLLSAVAGGLGGMLGAPNHKYRAAVEASKAESSGPEE